MGCGEAAAGVVEVDDRYFGGLPLGRLTGVSDCIGGWLYTGAEYCTAGLGAVAGAGAGAGGCV